MNYCYECDHAFGEPDVQMADDGVEYPTYVCPYCGSTEWVCLDEDAGEDR